MPGLGNDRGAWKAPVGSTTGLLLVRLFRCAVWSPAAFLQTGLALKRWGLVFVHGWASCALAVVCAGVDHSHLAVMPVAVQSERLRQARRSWHQATIVRLRGLVIGVAVPAWAIFGFSPMLRCTCVPVFLA